MLKSNKFDSTIIPDNYIDDCIKTYNYDNIKTIITYQNLHISLNVEKYLLLIIKNGNIKCLKLLLSDKRFQDINVLNNVFIKSIKLLNKKSIKCCKKSIKCCKNLYLCNELILSYIDYNKYLGEIHYYIKQPSYEPFNVGLFYFCYIKLLFGGYIYIDKKSYDKAQYLINNNNYIYQISYNKSRLIINDIISISLRSDTLIYPIKNDIIDIIWNNYGQYLYNSYILKILAL